MKLGVQCCPASHGLHWGGLNPSHGPASPQHVLLYLPQHAQGSKFQDFLGLCVSPQPPSRQGATALHHSASGVMPRWYSRPKQAMAAMTSPAKAQRAPE